jgi:hypothetical protein
MMPVAVIEELLVAVTGELGILLFSWILDENGCRG